MTEPTTTGIWPPPTTAKPRRRWAVPILAVLVVALAAALAFVLMRQNREAGTPVADELASEGTGRTPLQEASSYCNRLENYGGRVGDRGRSLDFDMAGTDLGSGEGTNEAFLCLLFELHAPDYVYSLMESTRALDGRQTTTWDAFEASWVYHPDTGLDFVIRMV